MRHAFLVSLFGLTFASAFAATACSMPSEEEDVAESESGLVQFPAAAFTNAPQLSYGDTSAAIATSRTEWGVVRWNGSEGDELVATVASTTPDRLPRAYLVEKRADGKYVAILSGTSSADGLVKAKLAQTHEYFIVFRDRSRRNATFTVKLDKAGGLPAACTGAPLLNQGFVERTPQAQAPGLSVVGEYKSSIRRCNVATGCADPVVTNNANAQVSFTRRADGKWLMGGVVGAEHDGATGELKGTVNVRADDGRNIPVAVAGAATTSCISLSGRTRNAIDAITYYDVEVTYQATTPAVAPRTTYPAEPPPPDCEANAVITDEEVLARFPRGSASVNLGQATVLEDSQYCHPETGCRAWTFGATNPQFQLRATAQVTGPSTLGVSFYNSYWGNQSPVFALEDGVVAITSDVLKRDVANTKNTSFVSDTHLMVKESSVYKNGDWKYRRYVCIPIPAHP